MTEKLESAEAERAALLSERETSGQASAEEKEQLLRRVTSLSEEKDRQQEMLEELRQEKKRLGAELEGRMETLQTEVWVRFLSEFHIRCVAAHIFCTHNSSSNGIFKLTSLRNS